MTRFSLDIPPGLVSHDTSYSTAPRWRAGSNVRFYLGRPQTIGGWETLVQTDLTGVCRTIFPWTNNSAVLNVAFGTHSALQVYLGGTLYTITPGVGIPPKTLSSNPLSVVIGTPTVTVSQPGHRNTTGDAVVVSGATAVGGITPNGSFTVTSTTTNTWTYTFGSNATSTATGGGSAVLITATAAFAAGYVDGTGSVGYGTGAWGIGGYGSPSTADYFPRTWSFGAWGAYLIACPRNGTIYEWQGNTASVAAPLSNAPAQVTYSLVAPLDGGYQVFALGCSEESSGVFNPLCIRHSGIRNNTSWTTTSSSTAREYVLTGGGRIVGGKMVGSNMFVWTTVGLYVGTFIGNLNQPWKFEQIGRNCGLIGPNAMAVVGQTAYWISPDRQFWMCSPGGAPAPIACPIRPDFADNLSAAQSDKIVASTIAEYGEVRWDYPDSRDGYENSRYLAVTVSGDSPGSWYQGIMARTAMVDAGPSNYPIGTTYDGQTYWHERGTSADGSAMSWYLQSGDQYMDENASMFVRCIWPDVSDQLGPVYITFTTRYKPQGTETTYGPYTMAVDEDMVNVRVKGRLFKIKFSGDSTPTRFRLGKPILDARPGGIR